MVLYCLVVGFSCLHLGGDQVAALAFSAAYEGREIIVGTRSEAAWHSFLLVFEMFGVLFSWTTFFLALLISLVGKGVSGRIRALSS